MTKKPAISATRARALLHMQRMVATSAAAVAVGDIGCHPKDKNAADASMDATAFGPPTADAGPTAVVEPTPSADASTYERTHGYSVVDPIPRPAHCPELEAFIKSSAVKQGGNIVVTVTNAEGKSGFKYEKTRPQVYGGTLVKNAMSADGSAVVTFKPAGDSATVSLKGTCNTGIVSISVNIGADLQTWVREY